MPTRIAKLLSFVRTLSNGANVSNVEVDTGGGDNKTAQHFSAPGDDSFPLKTDFAIVSNVAGSGNKAVHGYIDPINEPGALEGEKRIYARDPATGAAVIGLWLKNDGSGSMRNANGSIVLQANGDVVINGVTITANGAVTIPTSLTLNSKEIAGHDHPIAWTDPAGSGTSGPNN